jgi:methylenetetrahydrofolate reductase (NADPH)
VPKWLVNHLDGLDDDPDTRRLIAVALATELCVGLQERGFEDFHFYTLNRSDLVYAICRMLGLRETAAAQA